MGKPNQRRPELEAAVGLSSNEALLEVRHLEVTYHSPGQPPTRALEGISFQIRRGESLAIVGESGSGKSTLALAVLRLLPPYSTIVRGTVCFDGQDITLASESALQKIRGAKIGMVFQQPGMSLNPLMRVSRQVAEVIRAHYTWPWSQCQAKAMLLLERVFGSESGRLSQAYPHQLSGGQRQRVSIAQALACGPQLIIADEPTASLDGVVEAGILQIFHELRANGNVSLLFITHNPAILPDLADRVLVLRSGAVVEQGILQDVFRRPREQYTADLLYSLPIA